MGLGVCIWGGGAELDSNQFYMRVGLVWILLWVINIHSKYKISLFEN